MKITESTVDYIAKLAKFDLSEVEKDRVGKDLERILSYMERMNEIDTEEVKPASHVFPTVNVFREDVAVITDNREQLLQNAPMKKDRCFVVPKTVE